MRSQLPQVDRAGPGCSPARSRSSSVPPAIATGSSGRFRRRRLEPEAIAKTHSAQPAGQEASSKRPVYAVLTNCTYDGMCYDAADAERCLRKSVDRIHFDEAWYALCTIQSDVSRPPRDAGQPRRSSDGRPHRIRDAFHTQMPRGTLADLVYPHPRRPRGHRPWPLQRGLLLAGQHVTALCAHCIE